MKFLLLFFCSFTFYGQVLHHQMLSSQGASVKLSNGISVTQTIGQQGIIGNSDKKNIVIQGFQQSLWSTYIASNDTEVISTKTYPNPFSDSIKFEFSTFITDPIIINVFDSSGRLVYEGRQGAIGAILSINLSHLPTNHYLVHLYTNSFSYYTKIIKI